MKLSNIIKEYKDRTDNSVLGNGSLAIRAKEPNKVPILVSQKWETNENKMLTKTFFFKNVLLRNRFVTEVFEYETTINHYSTITISEKTVLISINTKRINVVTEFDKEYAKYVDLIYKDIMYSSIICPDE